MTVASGTVPVGEKPIIPPSWTGKPVLISATTSLVVETADRGSGSYRPTRCRLEVDVLQVNEELADEEDVTSSRGGSENTSAGD
jgi:hypothetical protein